MLFLRQRALTKRRGSSRMRNEPTSVDAELEEVLKQVLEVLSVAEAPWVVTGSTAFALQRIAGIGKPQDLDLQTTRAGSIEIEALLVAAGAERLRPVDFSESPGIRSWFGRLRMLGVASRSWATWKREDLLVAGVDRRSSSLNSGG
jgi:hypothetical protein